MTVFRLQAAECILGLKWNRDERIKLVSLSNHDKIKFRANVSG